MIFLKLYFLTSYCPLQIWPLKTCNPEISNIIMARSFKRFGQGIQDVEDILIDKLMDGGTVFYKPIF